MQHKFFCVSFFMLENEYTLSRHFSLWIWMHIPQPSPGNNFTVIACELHQRGSLEWMMARPVRYSRMHSRHLPHRVRGQRYMWAAVTRLKVTLPDKSNPLHWHEPLEWWASHPLAMPSRRSGIDGRAARWELGVPTSCLCVFISTVLQILSQR